MNVSLWTYCRVLQFVAVSFDVLLCAQVDSTYLCVAVWFSVVQCGAVWCNVVQCGAIWCSVVQHGAV